MSALYYVLYYLFSDHSCKEKDVLQHEGENSTEEQSWLAFQTWDRAGSSSGWPKEQDA